MSKERLTRKELKQDKFVFYIDYCFSIMLQNKEKVIIVIITLIAILLAWISLNYQKEKVAYHAIEELNWAKEKYEKGKVEEVEKVFLDIAQKYTKEEAGREAILYLSNYYYMKEEYNKCIDFTDNMIKQLKKSNPIYPNLLLIQAYCYESLKQYEYAIKRYEELVNTYSENYFVPDAYVSLARCYNFIGNKNASSTQARAVLQKYPGSLWAQKAKTYL